MALGALVALAIPQNAWGAPTIGFDAIFYRARAAFHYCYKFEGVVGYSLRPIPASQHISHDPGEACLADPDNDSRAFTLTACGGACQADCTSFVRKAWHAEKTSETLTQRDVPGPCSGPDGSSGETRIVDKGQDAEAVYQAIDTLRPGDGCENEVHTVMVVNRIEGHQWRTWEANSAAGGIGQYERTIDPFLEITSSPDVCGFGLAGNGCWRPNAVRTGPPTLLSPSSGVKVDDLSAFAFKFQRPTNFPALADYLLWIRWDANEGTGKPADIQHRLVRIPAYEARYEALATRLARFPNVTAPCPDVPGQTCPADITEPNIIEVPADLLTAVPAWRPSRFKDPNEGEIITVWRDGLVPCAPTTPVARTAEALCTYTQETLSLEAGRTYTWQVRVDRYGEKASGFRRGTAIGACKLDSSGHETDAVCKDPEWSPPSTFTSEVKGECLVQLRPCTISDPEPVIVTCPLAAGRWVIDPDTIAGCFTALYTACGYTFDLVSLAWRYEQFDSAGNSLASGICGARLDDKTATCEDVLAFDQRWCGEKVPGTSWCECENLVSYPFQSSDGKGWISFDVGKDVPDCSRILPPVTGTLQFKLKNCAAPGNGALPGCSS